MIDPNEAPAGYYAVVGKCVDCDLNEDRCIWPKCSSGERKDGCAGVILKKIEEKTAPATE